MRVEIVLVFGTGGVRGDGAGAGTVGGIRV